MSEEKRVIKLDQEKTATNVKATYCLWFAYAPDDIAGPEGETTNSTYKPLEIDLTNVAELTVTASPDDKWWHHPGNDSGAEGIADERNLENEAYKSATYHSTNIAKLETRLNLLVGLLGDENPPTVEREQIKIGLEKTITIDNANDTRLFLGFHDGRQWSNNGQDPAAGVSVTITVDKRR